MRDLVAPKKIIFDNTNDQAHKIITYPGTTQSITLRPHHQVCLLAETSAEIAGFLSQAGDGLTVTVVAPTAVEATEAAGFKGVVEKGGDVVVSSPISVDKTQNVKKDISLNLISTLSFDKAAGTTAFLVDGCNMVVSGNGRIETPNGYAIAVKGNGKLTIEGGNFYGAGATLIHLQDGEVEILGGTFKMEGESVKEYGNTYLLNVLDTNRGSSFITVKGGTFWGFDPSSRPDEIIVPEGYKVVKPSKDVYQVVKA